MQNAKFAYTFKLAIWLLLQNIKGPKGHVFKMLNIYENFEKKNTKFTP